MRWDDLFADLDAQAEALEVAQRAAEVDERARIEFAAIPLVARLQGAVGSQLQLRLSGGLTIAGTAARVGPDWLLCAEATGREALVPLAAVQVVHGLGRQSALPGSQGPVLARLTLRTALRGLAQDRSAVRAHLVDGAVLDATIDRVGADFIEVAQHPAGEARRRSEVREVVVVPFAVLAAVRRSAT